MVTSRLAEEGDQGEKKGSLTLRGMPRNGLVAVCRSPGGDGDPSDSGSDPRNKKGKKEKKDKGRKGKDEGPPDGDDDGSDKSSPRDDDS